MNREDFQKLSAERVRDARALLGAGRYAAAYYLCGYAVECALKACIAKRTIRHDFPDKIFAATVYTHDLVKLLNAAGLTHTHQQHVDAHPAFGTNWAIVKDWSETKRYERTITESQARDFYSATTARANGVLKWIKAHW